MTNFSLPKHATATFTLARACVALLVTTHAYAEANGASVDYRAPVDCPDRADFVKAVEARLSRATDRTSLAPVTQIDVSVAADSSAYVGSLRIDFGGAESVARTLSDSQCRALVDVLALHPSGCARNSASSKVRAPPCAKVRCGATLLV